MENLTKKWIRPNMVLNISHFGLDLGIYVERKDEEKKRKREENKRRREEEKKKEERKERRISF